MIQKKAVAQKIYEGVLYTYNSYNINPAYTGYNQHLSILLNYRSASSNIEGMPEQLMFGIHSPVFKNMGLGLRIENYSEGLFNYFTSFVDYSYFVNINKAQVLRFGISAGYSSNTLDQSNMIATDPSAIIEIAKQNFTGNNFISAAGIVYQYDKLEVSLASPLLFATGKSFNPSVSAAASYNFRLMNEQISLKPFIYTLYTKDLPLIFDIMAVSDYKNLFRLGIGYRNRKAVILSTGISFSNFTFNYAVDIGTSKLSNIFNIIHELSISYGIQKIKQPIKDSLYNPPLIVKNDSITDEKIVRNDSITNEKIIKNDSITDKEIVKNDSISKEKNIVPDTTNILVSINTADTNTINMPTEKQQEKNTIIETDSINAENAIQKDSLKIAQNKKENITVKKLAPGIYKIETGYENKNLKKEEIDKAIANQKQQEKIKQEKNEEIEKNTDFLNQYYTIFLDIEKNAEIIDINFDLIENLKIIKDSKGKAFYTYGLFLTPEEAKQTALMLEKRGFEILEINKIGKN